MIDLESAVLKKIKRANTEWWINERAVVGENGLTYIVYMNDMGEIHIKELDAKCSKTPSRDFRLAKLNFNYADEHNAASICIMESGKIIVAYTGHACGGKLTYRITERPYDIFSFGEPQTINYGEDVSYAQISENTERGELWLFTRVHQVNWEFTYSCDEGKTWSKPQRFIHSSDGGLFYFNVHKMYLPSSEKSYKEQWFFALYGHPKTSRDHTIRSGIITSDGKLMKTDGKTSLGIDLFDLDKYLDLNSLDVVYKAPEGMTVRLLENSSTLPLRVGFAPFVMNDPTTPTYYSATFSGGEWHVSEPICRANEFLTAGMNDGSQTYLGGMAYYYGVGEAGLHPCDPAPTCTNRIYIARCDGENRVVESYLSTDCGKTYRLEQTLRKIPNEKDIKTWRPIVPVHAQDNLPVYWHEGVYTAHTGGWHSDAVMWVEYDD